MIDIFIAIVLTIVVYASASTALAILWKMDWIAYGVLILICGILAGIEISFKESLMLALLCKFLWR